MAKEEIKEYMRAYYQAHKEEKKAYYQANKDKIKKHSKEYYESHKNEMKEHSKKWYQEHKDKMREYRKKWYQEHKDEQNSRCKEWNKEHKEEIKTYQKYYHKSYNRKDSGNTYGRLKEYLQIDDNKKKHCIVFNFGHSPIKLPMFIIVNFLDNPISTRLLWTNILYFVLSFNFINYFLFGEIHW